MRITVKLFAHFRDGRFREKVLELPQGSTVKNMVESLGIDPEEVGVTMINSRHCSLEDTLARNDILAIFPMVGGG